MCYVASIWKRGCLALPVLANWACMGAVYYCFLEGFILSVEKTVLVWTVLAAVHVLALLTLGSLLMVLCTDPGGVPESLETSIETGLTQGLLSNMNPVDFAYGQVTFCAKCNRPRPPRAHHCTVCERCVLRYDHHCPWVGNCIGLFNVRYFLQYLLYLTLTALSVGLLSLFALLKKQHDVYLMGSTVLGLAVGVAVGGFSLMQVALLANNSTTLEVRASGFNIFDMSCKENCRQVCGTHLLCWLLPVPARPLVDGVFYPLQVRLEDGERLEVRERLLLQAQ